MKFSKKFIFVLMYRILVKDSYVFLYSDIFRNKIV